MLSISSSSSSSSSSVWLLSAVSPEYSSAFWDMSETVAWCAEQVLFSKEPQPNEYEAGLSSTMSPSIIFALNPALIEPALICFQGR